MYFARQFFIALDESWESNSKVKISFYKEIPQHSSQISPWGSCQREMNEEKKFREIDNFDDATEDLFNQAVYVHIFIAPVDKNKTSEYAAGIIECKGLLPNLLTFWMPVDEIREFVKEKIGKLRWTSFKIQSAPSGLDGHAIHCLFSV